MVDWRNWLKGKNQPGKNHGGNSAQNTGGNKHGRSSNAAKNIKKKGKGNK